MSDTSRYEILDSLPSYGPMYIPISEYNKSFYSEGFVVRFYTSIHTNWVGNFEPGWSGFNAVYDFGPELYVLVIAGGICYLMNPDDNEPISIFGVHCQMVIKGLDGKLILNECVGLLCSCIKTIKRITSTPVLEGSVRYYLQG